MCVHHKFFTQLFCSLSIFFGHFFGFLPNVQSQILDPHPPLTGLSLLDKGLTCSLTNDHEDEEGFIDLLDCINCRVIETKSSELAGSMITTKQTLLYLVPIQEDFALAENGKGYKLWVKQGMRFHITKVRTLKDANAKQTEFGLLGNTFGGKFISILLLASENGGVGEKFVRKTDRNSPVVTYIAGAEDVYPNKVENILLALKNISAYQERHKGWQPGKYYSVLRALGFYNDEAFKEYKPGKLATGGIAPAGGVCAVSTGIASLLYRTENAQIIDIVHHGKESLYFQGPFSPPAEEVDSGISISADGGFEELGFKVPKSGFLKIDILVLPSGLSHEETDPKGLSGRSDSVLLFSFSFTEEIIADQSNAISALILKFKEYRESKHGKNLDILISQDPRLFIMEKDLFANFQLVYERPNP